MTTLFLGVVFFLGLLVVLGLSIPIRSRKLKEPWDLSIHDDAPEPRPTNAETPPKPSGHQERST